MRDGAYLGRFQQGSEIALVLQCTNAVGTPDDPSYLPTAQIWRDDPMSMIDSQFMPSDMRGVEDGVFRLPYFLGSLFSVAGRYIVVFKWTDSGGVARSGSAAFHIVPGGSADGSVIAMHYSSRPDAGYLVFQCDSGRLIRKPNPR